MSINETVLEMHFHNPIFDLFRETLGLGEGNFNFFKYSPQRECFVGFDQAFVRTDLSEDALFNKLKASARDDGYSLSNFFLGYFLQYKVVKTLQKRMRHTPHQITARPHYRVSLDTIKNINTGQSQHELLFNLNRNQGALVYYACPMLFDRSELYREEPDLDLLRLADLSDCPSIYDDNESHFIYFNDTGASPIWCSNPTEGKAYKPSEVVENVRQQLIDPAELRENQLRLLDSLKGVTENVITRKEEKILSLVADSLTILQFTSEEPNKQRQANG
ncbi:hypothetical protein [Pseudohongiella sp. O18]|uniref:hypothetical protein n=1 Tax=Pseudohongiella sp. O18 TaxID=2904248 RepID=UPI001F486B14|nr:hypothetical protein [Pseudohongiella sp. O18]